jgi:ubiquinone/menaquinone biosynthesis C-methylase UbiE
MSKNHESSPHRTPEQLREHYLIEKELADQLRHAEKDERQNLYPRLYDELFRRLPNHPGLARKISPEITREEVDGQMAFLKNHLNQGDTFLEIGAGDCALSFEACNFVKKVFAVDVSAIKTESSNQPSNFELILTTGTTIPLPDNSIDIAYSHAFFEHLHPEDGLDHLRNVRRVLKAGGIYLCVVPQRLNGPWDISRNFDQIPQGFHLKEYSACELEGVFKQVGFSKADIVLHVLGKFYAIPKPIIWIYESLFAIMPYSIRRPLAGRFLFDNVRIIGRK